MRANETKQSIRQKSGSTNYGAKTAFAAELPCDLISMLPSYSCEQSSHGIQDERKL